MYQAGVACLALGLATALMAGPLPDTVQQALDQAGVPADAVSMLVVPLQAPAGTVSEQAPETLSTGEASARPPRPEPVQPRLAWRSDVAMNPASVMKLVTTQAALDLLGPHYFWKTRVYIRGYINEGVLHGDLLIQGSGDPKLVRERLLDLLLAVQDKDVRHIDGDILLDNSVFSLPAHDPAAFDNDPLRPYNAGPDGLLVNFRTLTLRFAPRRGQKQVGIELDPPMAGLAVPAGVPVVAGACGAWRTRLGLDFADPAQLNLTGAYPASCGEQEWHIAYPDPAGHAPRVIEGLWREAGGSLSGQVKWLDRPATGSPLVTGYSLPLIDIVGDVNRFSNNVMAQQLFLTLSAAGSGHGSFAESRNVLARWWRAQFGLRTMPQVDNGSGLSRSARVSADSLEALLQHAAVSPHAQHFELSLPLAGVNGTARGLAWRRPDSTAIGRARIKTGSLRDVRALAGYVFGDSGQTYVVVAMVNHERAEQTRDALDRLLEWAVQDQ